MRAMLLAIGIALLVAVELGSPPPNPRPAEEISDEPVSDPCAQSTLTKPVDLLLLEGPDRAVWQKPDQIMDELHIADGSAVADIGAGSGWFTIRLAQRVGQLGTVYAQDVQAEMLNAITRRVSREGLKNVQIRRGQDNSTNLPLNALDAILVVDVYGEVPAPVQFLLSLTESLKPQGRIGIVNYKPGSGGPGPICRRVSDRAVMRDAEQANLRVISTTDLRYQYLVVLGR